jgi:hypothetical protein
LTASNHNQGYFPVFKEKDYGLKVASSSPAGRALCAATVQQPGRKTAAFSVKATYAYVADLAYL